MRRPSAPRGSSHISRPARDPDTGAAQSRPHSGQRMEQCGRKPSVQPLCQERLTGQTPQSQNGAAVLLGSRYLPEKPQLSPSPRVSLVKVEGPRVFAGIRTICYPPEARWAMWRFPVKVSSCKPYR